MNFRILVLGGYGNFGARIVRRLSGLSNATILIAGRNPARARSLADELASRPAHIVPASVDIDTSDLPRAIASLGPKLVIHTCGPFQQRDYRVADAAIAARSHYVDLADGRDFVAGFAALDAQARAADVLAVSGASTVPGITAAVLDRLCRGCDRIQRIDIGVSPGNRTERGAATVRAILSYVGAPVRVWRGSDWRNVHGWQSLRYRRYPAPMGRRWLAVCDVPDLALFPERYRAATVEFRAGLELSVLHLGLWLLSWLRRLRLVRDWSRYAGLLLHASRWFQHWGSAIGGMHVQVEGSAADGARFRREFCLVAGSNDGPQIPCTAAVVLASKLAAGQLQARGARPCLDLFDIDEILTELQDFDIQVRWQ